MQFDGDNVIDMGLVAVIKKNDGTGVLETIALDAARDADVELSVPLGEIASVGFIVSHATINGDGRAYSLTLTKELPLPN